MKATVETDTDYTVNPRSFSVGGTTSFFLVYKLTPTGERPTTSRQCSKKSRRPSNYLPKPLKT
ncbi:MAG: hypothetical protein MZU97_24095 [Bacillus subtilis]|nr:hypothetical protein [Bacillus subtilis]